MKRLYIPLIFLIAIVTVLVAGCSQQPAQQTAMQPTATMTAAPMQTVPVTGAASVMLTNDSMYGGILTDAKGMTLYTFTKDVQGNGTSACNGACAGLWPAFQGTNFEVSQPLMASDFGEITRADGTKQSTYKGWPLYYYIKDTNPGKALGQGVNGIWFVVGPSGVIKTSPPSLTMAPTTAMYTSTPTHNTGSGY